MPTQKPRYCITVDEELLKKIDDFRFENRFNSRSQATLALIHLGINALEKQQDSSPTDISESPYTMVARGGKSVEQISDPKIVKVLDRIFAEQFGDDTNEKSSQK